MEEKVKNLMNMVEVAIAAKCQKYLFEPITPETYENIKQNVSETVESITKGASFEAVDIKADYENNSINFKLRPKIDVIQQLIKESMDLYKINGFDPYFLTEEEIMNLPDEFWKLNPDFTFNGYRKEIPRYLTDEWE